MYQQHNDDHLSSPPSEVVDTVKQLKANGTFDQFRKECLSDIETKPAFQNLKSRVETFVQDYLNDQKWNPSLKKADLRENLRKRINDGGLLINNDIDYIVDQVVTPKIDSIFRPIIEKLINMPTSSFDYNSTLNSSLGHGTKFSSEIKQEIKTVDEKPTVQNTKCTIESESVKKEVTDTDNSNIKTEPIQTKEKELVESKQSTSTQSPAQVKIEPTTDQNEPKKAKIVKPNVVTSKPNIENVNKKSNETKSVNKNTTINKSKPQSTATTKQTTSKQVVNKPTQLKPKPKDTLKPVSTFYLDSQTLQTDPKNEYNFDWKLDVFDEVNNQILEEMSVSSVDTSDLSDYDEYLSSLNSKQQQQQQKEMEESSSQKQEEIKETNKQDEDKNESKNVKKKEEKHKNKTKRIKRQSDVNEVENKNYESTNSNSEHSMNRRKRSLNPKYFSSDFTQSLKNNSSSNSNVSRSSSVSSD